MDRQVAWAYGVAGLSLAVATTTFVAVWTKTEEPAPEPVKVDALTAPEEALARAEGTEAAEPSPVSGSSWTPPAEEVVYVDEQGNPLPAGWRAQSRRRHDDHEDDEEDDDHEEREHSGRRDRGEHDEDHDDD